jgi:hypothetical protein
MGSSEQSMGSEAGPGAGLGAAPGVWSITVEISNASGQDLLLDPANTTPPMSWIGDPPEWGSTLGENQSVTIGALVDMPQTGVTLYLGYRNGQQVPVTISAGTGPGTQNGCAVVRGSATTGVVTQLEPGDPQHLLFAVRLVPV